MEKGTKLALSRQITSIRIPQDKNMTFSIMHWNVLNDFYCTPQRYPKIKSDYLKSEYRKNLIAKEIFAHNADIVCLSEINKDDLTLYESILGEKQGYLSIYTEKLDGVDGLLFCFKKKKFEYVDGIQGEYLDLTTGKKYPQVYQLNVLRSLVEESKDYTLLIGYSHFKAKPEYYGARIEQATQLSGNFKTMREKLKKELGDKKHKLATILLGDFNDEVGAESIAILQDLGMNLFYEWEKFSKFYVREDIEQVFCDHMFYSSNLVPIERITFPTEERIGSNGLPNSEYPSDHLSIYSKFEFVGRPIGK